MLHDDSRKPESAGGACVNPSGNGKASVADICKNLAVVFKSGDLDKIKQLNLS